MPERVPHEVAEADLLAELAQLALPQQTKTCPKCWGRGWNPDQIPDAEGGDIDPCPRCQGTGQVTVYSIATYDHALSVAEWVASLSRQIAERAAAFDRRIARLQAEKEAALKPLQARVAFLQSLLEDYHRRVLQVDRRQKTIPLCGGVVLEARQTTRWEYGDEERLTEWLQQNAGNLVRTRLEPNKEELKKAVEVRDDGTVVLKETGEVIPGVRVAKETAFKVKVEVAESDGTGTA